MTAQPARQIAGDYAPWLHAKALSGSDRYGFHSVGGRHVLMFFFDSASQAALEVVAKNRAVFDDEHAVFFGVTIDPTEVVQNRIAQDLPGIRHILDYDRVVSRQFAVAKDAHRY